RHDAELDVALLDVIDRVALGALPEDVALGPVGRDGLAGADRCQEQLGVEILRRPGSGSWFPVRFATRLFAVPRFCSAACWHPLRSQALFEFSAGLFTIGQFDFEQSGKILPLS